MSFELGTPNTGAALAAQSVESVRILWQRAADVFEQTEDFWGKFEGESAESPIHVVNDTTKGRGMTFRITALAGFYGRGKSGDTAFLDEDDFEQAVINNNEFTADYLRDATSFTRRMDEKMGMVDELSSGLVEQLGRWMGREKSARAGMTFVLKGGSENLLYPGSNAAESTIVTGDGLSYNDILAMGQSLKPMGGKPCEVGTVRGSPVMKYCVAGTTPGLFSLKQDSSYQQILREAGPREKYDDNPLFEGGYMELDGHIIKEFNPIDPDGYAWAGSWFNAKAFLGTAITAGTAAFAIKGGGSAAAAAKTNIDYFRFFPNFAFEFTSTDIFVPGSDQQYLLIINPKGAVTASNPQPGSIGMYGYTTGNNGNQITINQRLASVQNGPVALATVGSVTWNTGVWAGRHSMVHPIGSTIVLCNAKGVPLGDTVMFGAMAMIRGYGQYRNQRDTWLVDGNFQTRTYITSVFGQVLRKNVNNKYPGYVRLRHALAYPELGLPVVV